MKRYSVLLIVFLLLSRQAYSSVIEGVNTVSDYLMVSTEQQKISLGRYLNANKDIAVRCMHNWTLDESNEYFLSWVNDHPQFVRRSVTTAFSAALLDACKRS